MPDDNFSSNQNNNQQVDPLISFDPLADQGGGNNSNNGTTPISPITPKPQSDFGGGEIVDYSLPENKEMARQKANELMDQGQFAEAAKILKESGMHQTVTPKPEAPASSATPPSQTPPPQIVPEPPISSPAASQPEVPTPTISIPEPDIATPPAPIPSAPAEIPIPQTPEPPAPEPTVNFPTPPIKIQATPPSTQEPPLSVQEKPQVATSPAPAVNSPSQTQNDDPDFFLKKAYDLRKNLLEYDRSKVAEEEKLQAAEDLVFQGKKEEAIKIYKTIAAEAEEKKEDEIAIEAYERLATLLR